MFCSLDGCTRVGVFVAQSSWKSNTPLMSEKEATDLGNGIGSKTNGREWCNGAKAKRNAVGRTLWESPWTPVRLAQT